MSFESPRAHPLPPSRRRPRRRGSWFLAGIPAVLLTGLPFVDVDPEVSVHSAWIIPAAQAIVLLLAAAALVAAVVFGLFRRVVGAVLLVIAAIVAGTAGLLPATSGTVLDAQPKGQDRDTVNVLSANVHLGQADAAALGRVVKERNVHVLVLAEGTEEFVGRLLADPEVAERLSQRTGALPAVGADGTAILSAGKLTEEEPAWPDGGRRFEQRTAVVRLPGMQAVRVVGVHIIPPTVSPAQWRTDLLELGNYQRALDDLPLIVAGDFNAGPATPAYREAMSGLAESSSAWPTPPIMTWPTTRLPVAQLDHILTRELQPHELVGIEVPGTDHLALGLGVRGLRVP